MMGYALSTALSGLFAVFVTWFLHRKLSKWRRWIIVISAGLTPTALLLVLVIWFQVVGYDLNVMQALAKLFIEFQLRDYLLFASMSVGGLVMSFVVSIQFGRFHGGNAE